MDPPSANPQRNCFSSSGRGLEKKNWEVAQCHAVAQEINRVRQTDYEARSSGRAFPDVYLISTSGKHPKLEVEVVSIPVDPKERDQKDSDEKIRRGLARLLSARNLKHYQLYPHLTDRARAHGMSGTLLERLAEVVAEGVAQGNARVRFDEIYRHSPELAKYVDDIVISHYKSIPGVEIDVAEGQWLPSDGRWIEQGVVRKLKKYGGPTGVKDLVLVIGVFAFVDDEQISAFRAANPVESLPFSEIWIVSYDRVICLKQRTGGDHKPGGIHRWERHARAVSNPC
jgi:hypothetical protein